MATASSTQPTDVDPVAYCAELPTERRRTEASRLLELFGDVTGQEPVLWGTSLIGYGTYEDQYASGHSGTWFLLGFSPRKAAISLYGLHEAPRAEEVLAQLGKHRLGKGCVSVNGLKDVDEDALRRLLEDSWAQHSPAGG